MEKLKNQDWSHLLFHTFKGKELYITMCMVITPKQIGASDKELLFLLEQLTIKDDLLMSKNPIFIHSAGSVIVRAYVCSERSVRACVMKAA